MSRNLRKSQRGSNHVRRSARLNALQSCQSQDKTSGNLKMMYIVFKDRMRCEFWRVLAPHQRFYIQHLHARQ